MVASYRHGRAALRHLRKLARRQAERLDEEGAAQSLTVHAVLPAVVAESADVAPAPLGDTADPATSSHSLAASSLPLLADCSGAAHALVPIIRSASESSTGSADGAAVSAFGCELFIRALTTRAWAFAELSNRHTLQQRDLLAAIMSDDMYDFLIDVTSDAILAMQKKQKAAAEAAAAL